MSPTEKRKIRQQTPEGWANHLKAVAAYRERHREKYAAQRKLKAAVKSGKVVRPSHCFMPDCHGTKIEGHHYDYSQPLMVIWLCESCHKEVHKLARQVLKGVKK